MKSVGALKSIPDRVSRFRELCLLYVEYVGAEGVKVRPFVSAELPKFSALPKELQERALVAITVDLEIFESMKAEGQSLRDTPKLLWRSMSRLRLLPQSDIFDKLGEDDVVEIYLLDEHGQRQIFRNLRFMDFVSYTLEEMFGLDWRLASVRDEQATSKIQEVALGIMTGEIVRTFDPEIEEHTVQEVGTEGLFTLNIKLKYMSPVRSGGRVVGAIAVNQSRLLGSLRHE